jgi:ubiquinone/menaquinone biosynthesis C-methylase UbiE
MSSSLSNVDERVTAGFGDEWNRFDQSTMPAQTLQEIFEAYFRVFPWADLPFGAVGADFGCGSGRWALCVAPKVGKLFCVDASKAALEVARRNLASMPNCEFHNTSVGDLQIPEKSLDFAYSLGVLHHIPDTGRGLESCVRTLKLGAPFLLYLYYAMENRPTWYRLLWSMSNILRVVISRLPYALRYLVSEVIAALIYWPLARLARIAGVCGVTNMNFPLHAYADKPFYVMRTDALDRFGTRLERRFSRQEMQKLMESAGLRNIRFSEQPPFWCAVGYRG